MDELKFSDEEISGMATAMDIKYFECSVKKNINIYETVDHIIDVLIEKLATRKNGKVAEEAPILLESTRTDRQNHGSKCAC